MAQSSSVAREPSMEEILASIRKIIEDNDSGRPAGDPRTASDLDGPRGAEDGSFGLIEEEDERPLAIRPDNINRQPDLEQFEERWEPASSPEPRESREMGRGQDPEKGGIALDVSSIGWRPDALAADALSQREPQPGQANTARRPESRPEPVRPAPVRPDAKQAAAGVTPRPSSPPADAARMRPTATPELRPTIHDRPMPTAIAPAARPQAGRPATPSGAPAAGAETPVAPREPAPVPAAAAAPNAQQTAPGSAVATGPASNTAGRLVSAATISKVSAAFDDLNHAVEVETRRTFDEIAEEILRPMLQDWLDDNLPRLVERLVREEIQRVARGIRS